MKSFKFRAVLVLIGVITLLGSIAVAISVSISITMLEKQNQLVKTKNDAVVPKVSIKPSSIMNIAKAEKYPIYFNGENQEGLTYYTDNKKDAMIPLDIIFKELNINFKLYSSDDAFKADFNGKPLILKLDTPDAQFAGNSIKLQTASIAAEDHIMASPEILDIVKGFETSSYTNKAGVFINYWPSGKNKEYLKTAILKLSNGKLDISDIFGAKSFNYGKNGPGKIDDIVYSPSLSAYIAESGDKTYFISKKSYTKPRILDVSKAYTISVDGRFLYWEDKVKKALYIYDIKNGIKKKLKDYFLRIKAENAVIPTVYRLLNYKSGKGYVRVDFQGLDQNDIYTIIERNGKFVAEGKSGYSPDSSRLLYFISSKGYYIADSDGTDIINVGNASEAEWIDNHRVLLTSDGHKFIFDKDDKSRKPVDIQWKYVGQTLKGEVFVLKDKTLFSIAGGPEKQILELPWKCDYVYSLSNKDPYTAISIEEDGVFRISDNKSVIVGRPSLFLNKPSEDNIDRGFDDNIALSSDNKKIAVLQRGKAFAEINIMSQEDMQVRKLVLNYPLINDSTYIKIKMMWLDNDRIIAYTPGKGWLIDIKTGTYIYEWMEKEESTIMGILQQAQ